MAIPNGWALDPARKISEGESYLYEDKIEGVFNSDNSNIIDSNIVITVSQKNGTITFFEKDRFGRRESYLLINASGNRSSTARFIALKGKKQDELEKLSIKAAKKIIAENPNKEESKKVLSQKLYAEPQSEVNPERNTGESEDEGNNNVSEGVFGITSEKFQKDEPFQQKFLRYPVDINSNQDRILITQKRYKAPDVLDGNGKIDSTKIIPGFSEERFAKIEDVLGSVTLPMPNDISETNVTAWGEDSLSSLSALIGGGALAGVIKFSEGDFSGAAGEVKDVTDQIFTKGTAGNQTVEQLLTLNAAAAVTKKLGLNLNAEAFRSRITGTAINPNLELLFQGPKLRSFAFQFKMIPRSEKEAKNIRYILKFFKKGMAAKRNFTDPQAAYFLGAPNVFDIQFKLNDSGREIDSIGKIKTCALQQCVVNYTPDGFYAAFEDDKVGSQPIAVVMQLAFTELTPLYNDNYDEGNTNSVGFDKPLKDGPSGIPN
jgi:hypothetical protein